MSTGIFNKHNGYHNRRSIRLRSYNYAQAGKYFVTICIHDRRQRLFGDVANGKMIENDHGNIVRNCWDDLSVRYSHIQLDEFAIMPNHIHGIIVIRDAANCDRAPTKTVKPRPITLGNIVAYFKYQSTKQINSIRQHGIEKVWQRNYFEHVIRNEESLFVIRNYIRDNPIKWDLDSEDHIDTEIREMQFQPAGK